MKIFKSLFMMMLVSILVGACASPSRDIASSKCSNQQWVDADNNHRDYERCKDY